MRPAPATPCKVVRPPPGLTLPGIAPNNVRSICDISLDDFDFKIEELDEPNKPDVFETLVSDAKDTVLCATASVQTEGDQPSNVAEPSALDFLLDYVRANIAGGPARYSEDWLDEIQVKMETAFDMWIHLGALSIVDDMVVSVMAPNGFYMCKPECTLTSDEGPGHRWSHSPSQMSSY